MINLNLISPKLQSSLKTKTIYYTFERYFGILIFMLIVFSSGLIPLTQSVQTINARLENEKRQKTTLQQGLTKEITSFNSQVNALAEIKNLDYDWLNLIQKLSQIVPANIEIKNFEAGHSQKSFRLVGFAKTREDYLILKENLEKSQLFKNLDSPISDILKKENLNFTINGNFE